MVEKLKENDVVVFKKNICTLFSTPVSIIVKDGDIGLVETIAGGATWVRIDYKTRFVCFENPIILQIEKIGEL